MSLADWFRKQLELDAESAIELSNQEKIIHVTGRHYIVLLARLIIPGLALLIFGGFAIYRAIGGGFFVSESGAPIGLDLLNWALLVVIGLLVVLWLTLWVRAKKTGQARWVLLFVCFVLGYLVFYRYNGGRVFFVDRAMFPDQGFDFVNIVLILLAVISVGAILFNVYDWLNDELIVTNQRVVYDNDQVIIPRLIEQRQQQQIFLEDVQDVSAATKTYPQHWLGYGTIEVKSARFNGNITFSSAKDPKAMQAAIMGQVKALRKSMTDQNYGRLVGERVYGLKGGGNKASLKSSQSEGWRWLRKIVPANPEVNEETGQFVWRRHWIFLALSLLAPFAVLVGGLLIIVIAANTITLNPLWATLGVVAVILFWLGWTAWRIEDYRNDQYILTRDKVIDIEKKPYGPEDRREANLSQVNNVSSKTTYLSNFLGYGDVVLTTAGSGGAFTFNKVPRPGDVVGRITDYNVSAKRSDKDRTLNDTLELLKFYHEAQLQRDEINKPPA
jgi:hypothetical protein